MRHKKWTASLIEEHKNHIRSELKKKDLNKEELLEVHQRRLEFFEWERLVHLIVTIGTAIMFLITMLATIFLQNMLLLVVDGLLALLFIPYICYYFKLENDVQSLYLLYDEIEKVD